MMIELFGDSSSGTNATRLEAATITPDPAVHRTPDRNAVTGAVEEHARGCAGRGLEARCSRSYNVSHVALHPLGIALVWRAHYRPCHPRLGRVGSGGGAARGGDRFARAGSVR